MLKYLWYLLFILSVALAAGGVVISSKLRSRYRNEIFSTLLYFQVFIYTFGFYGIWGQVVIKTFLSTYISADLLTRFSDFAMLMGLPFLVFGWMMLIRFSMEISGRKNSNWHVFWFLLINLSVIVIVGYFITRNNDLKPVSLIKSYFIVMNILYSFSASLLIMFPKKGRSVIHDYDRRIIAPVIILIMIIQCTPVMFYSSQIYMAIAFIFTFFAGNTFLPLYLNYGTLLPGFTDETIIVLHFDDFCKKFEISPRETDIIREICNGLSNKEISERLFISLQTVKDHTHRIYIKTNVKSRVQLINLVKDAIKT
jgi:DNA-binding CsgD family transcriptional regulator